MPDERQQGRRRVDEAEQRRARDEERRDGPTLGEAREEDEVAQRERAAAKAHQRADVPSIPTETARLKMHRLASTSACLRDLPLSPSLPPFLPLSLPPARPPSLPPPSVHLSATCGGATHHSG
jgi:hypothetical protein